MDSGHKTLAQVYNHEVKVGGRSMRPARMLPVTARAADPHTALKKRTYADDSVPWRLKMDIPSRIAL